jgi:hypothetical protein
LFRTPVHSNGQPSADYLSQAKKRLAEQAAELVDVTRGEALAVSKSVSERAAQTVGELKERVQDLTTQSASAARRAATETTEHARQMWSGTADALEQAGRSARSSASAGMSRAADAVGEWTPALTAKNSAAARDKLLLGAAGVAVATALGVAWQRRMEENADAN